MQRHELHEVRIHHNCFYWHVLYSAFYVCEGIHMLVCMNDGGKLCVLVWGCVSRGQRLKVYLSIALRLIFKEDSIGCTDWPASPRDPPGHNLMILGLHMWDTAFMLLMQVLGAEIKCHTHYWLIWPSLQFSSLLYKWTNPSLGILWRKTQTFFPGRIFTGWNHLRKNKNIWLRKTVMSLWFSIYFRTE